jgi:hypothetical protein
MNPLRKLSTTGDEFSCVPPRHGNGRAGGGAAMRTVGSQQSAEAQCVIDGSNGCSAAD